MGMLGNQNDGQKPLFRQWVRQQIKAGTKECDISDIVKSIKMSGSGEWIVIECQNSVALLNAESKVGVVFWEAVTQFKGGLKLLEVYPAKGKLGFDVKPSESGTGYWYFDEDEDKVVCDEEEGKSQQVSGLSALTLEAMQPVPITSVQSNKKPSKKE